MICRTFPSNQWLNDDFHAFIDREVKAVAPCGKPGDDSTVRGQVLAVFLSHAIPAGIA